MVDDTGTTTEGPLEHAARVNSEQAYLDSLTDGAQAAFERSSGGRPRLASKRLLVSISHTVERAVLSTAIEDPTVVVALFQELRFFDRERAVYERMARAGVHVVIAFVRGEDHVPPAGVHTVLLEPDEPLADEWSVVAAGPHAGAYLVATDQHRFDTAERNVELSRQFAGRWGFSRTQGASELARLRIALGDRLDPALCRLIDDLLAHTMPSGGQIATSAGTAGETWATTALHHMLDRMSLAQTGTRELRHQLAEAHLAAAARTAAELDPESGLPTAGVLDRWAEQSDDTELPVGLALFEFPELGKDDMRDDQRSYYAARQVAAAMSRPVGPVDALVRLSTTEFLLVVPGASVRHLAGLGDRIGEQLALSAQGYPHIDLTATTASIVTRSRPLPVDDLRVALEHLRGDEVGPMRVGTTVAGETITVASTGLYAPDTGQSRLAPDERADHREAAHPVPAVRDGTGEEQAFRPSGWWDAGETGVAAPPPAPPPRSPDGFDGSYPVNG